MKIKKRSEKKPFSVLFSSWDNAHEYVHLNEEIREKLEQLTPGPYTFLLRSKMKIEPQNSAVLGCRIADNQFCKKICNEFENPIVSTSANISGAKSPTNVYEIDKRLLRMADLVVDEGDTIYKDASTIIDVELKKIVRAGSELQKAKKWIENL
jgi:L-threonylcarbamoyladenylate synthase